MLAKEDYRQGGMVPAVGLEPPGNGHLQRFAYIFNPPQNIGRAQLMSGMSGRVHGPTHLAYLMRPALERRDAPADKASHNVLRSEAGIPQFTLNPVEGINRPHCGLQVIGLVLHHSWWLVHKWWQVQ
jgi:hypothetical protein